MVTSRPPAASTSRALAEGAAKAAEFVVGGHAEGLESAGGGVGPPSTVTGRSSDDLGKLDGVVNGPRADDGAGDTAGAGLLAEFVDEVGELLLGEGVDEVSGGGALRREAHIERARPPEAEAAVLGVELAGGEAEIEEESVGGNEVVDMGLAFEGVEVGVGEDDPVAVGQESAGGVFDSLGVGVEPEDPAARGGGVEDGRGVSAVADGAVDVGAAVADVEAGDDLGSHNGLVLDVVRALHCVSRVPGQGRCDW